MLLLAALAAAVLLLSLGTGVVFGVLPAWRASRLDPVAALREARKRGARLTFVNPLALDDLADVGETIQIRPDTDAYLLATAARHGSRLLTFDSGLLQLLATPEERERLLRVLN